MCMRINNVETLRSSKIWLFQDCPQTHPFLSSSLRRGEDEDGEGVQTLKLEDLHSAQINILAYKVRSLKYVMEMSHSIQSEGGNEIPF